MAQPETPGWTGAGGFQDTAWNQVGLGDVYLPGICTIEGLEVGVKLDVKAPKGSDQPTTKDNGAEPTKFQIKVQLTEADWPLWIACLPTFHPRRSGRKRTPLEIIHPEPNSLGIQNVRVQSIRSSAPTSRTGKVFVINCVEWFEEQKAQDKNTKDAKPVGTPAPAAQLEGIEGVLEHVDKRSKEGIAPADVATPANHMNNLFANSRPLA